MARPMVLGTVMRWLHSPALHLTDPAKIANQVLTFLCKGTQLDQVQHLPSGSVDLRLL